ncbi:hypothetical protein SJAG_04158 [Schizosaccharomyces japonicus yFS275]|uniref:Uncharacterized protein n=1 Tax=Schizosaccharomyces japonicus (strain yFS275 / FY16936) TaxID=402676 RepID=B6K629_SCHJY|nr:hypothetical protein SJAG_04158 [Schizosaccharomyces japonicus yFS275]EEB08983.1 hypothetical protein SJAG_04158 [Schizosaccharomyces japonicus yFS275]
MIQLVPKHQKLVRTCYPKDKTDSAVPVSSPLAYLCYYASCNSSKLRKVLAYLEVRTRSDVEKKKKFDTLITLQILKALIEKCNENLPVLAHNTFTILLSCLELKDLELAALCETCFSLFPTYTNFSVCLADQECCDQWNAVVDAFRDLSLMDYSAANAATPLSESTLAWRRIGLMALSSIMQCPSYPSNTLEARLVDLVVHACLCNLWMGDHFVTGAKLLQSFREPAARDMMPQLVKLPVPDDAQGLIPLAVYPIYLIHANVTGDRASRSISQLLHFAADLGSHESVLKWTAGLVEMCLSWNPIHMRALVPRALLQAIPVPPSSSSDSLTSSSRQQLRQSASPLPDSSPTADKDHPHRSVLVPYLLHTVLSSSYSLTGLNVLDTLQRLLDGLLQSADYSGSFVDFSRRHLLNADRSLACRYYLLAIGVLLHHEYYDEQALDVCSELLLQLQSAFGSFVAYHHKAASAISPLAYVDGRLANKQAFLLCEALAAFLENSKDAHYEQRRAVCDSWLQWASLMSSAFGPDTLSALLDYDVVWQECMILRGMFVHCLLLFLDLIPPSQISNSQARQLVHRLYPCISEWGSSVYSKADAVYLSRLTHKLLVLFPTCHISRMLPVLRTWVDAFDFVDVPDLPLEAASTKSLSVNATDKSSRASAMPPSLHAAVITVVAMNHLYEIGSFANTDILATLSTECASYVSELDGTFESAGYFERATVPRELYASLLDHQGSLLLPWDAVLADLQNSELNFTASERKLLSLDTPESDSYIDSPKLLTEGSRDPLDTSDLLTLNGGQNSLFHFSNNASSVLLPATNSQHVSSRFSGANTTKLPSFLTNRSVNRFTYARSSISVNNGLSTAADLSQLLHSVPGTVAAPAAKVRHQSLSRPGTLSSRADSSSIPGSASIGGSFHSSKPITHDDHLQTLVHLLGSVSLNITRAAYAPPPYDTRSPLYS